MTSFPSEVATYVGRIRLFERVDWSVYVGWVGLMLITQPTSIAAPAPMLDLPRIATPASITASAPTATPASMRASPRMLAPATWCPRAMRW